MLEGKDYRSSDKVTALWAALTDWSMDHEKTAPMMRMHTSYSVIAACMTGDMWQRTEAREISVTCEEVLRSS